MELFIKLKTTSHKKRKIMNKIVYCALLNWEVFYEISHIAGCEIDASGKRKSVWTGATLVGFHIICVGVAYTPVGSPAVLRLWA